MVGMRIQFGNVNKIEKFVINLPKKIDRELSRTNKNFMVQVLKSAKNKAPVDTGSLKESIKLKPVRRGKNVKRWKIVVTSPYALFQEEGFTPHTFFAGGAFNSSKMQPMKKYYVSKWTPFLQPAINEQIKTFDKKLNRAMDRAINKGR